MLLFGISSTIIGLRRLPLSYTACVKGLSLYSSVLVTKMSYEVSQTNFTGQIISRFFTHTSLRKTNSIPKCKG